MVRSATRWVVVAAVAALVGAAVGFTVAGGTGDGHPAPTFQVRGGVGHIAVVGVPAEHAAGTSIEVHDGTGATVAFGVVDAYGGLVFDRTGESGLTSGGDPLAPGLYQLVSTAPGEADRPLGPAHVLDESSEPPAGWSYGAQDLLAQAEPVDPAPVDPVPAPLQIHGPLATVTGATFHRGYLTVRDGTPLSYFLALPPGCAASPTTCDAPTVLEYSVYGPAFPGEWGRSIDPYLAQGYAVVGVNARGTGCSGGALRPMVLSRTEGLDGYDVVETIAAQSWSSGRVGMAGASYPGVSQLNVAATRPPHLAGIVPAASITDFYDLVNPGGVRNAQLRHFWTLVLLGQNVHYTVPLEDRLAELVARGFDTASFQYAPGFVLPPDDPSSFASPVDAVVAYDEGTGEVEGDQVCAANQALRGQIVALPAVLDDPAHQLRAGEGADLFAAASPRTFVDQIEAPTLLLTTLQDEQVRTDGAEVFPLLPDPGAATGTDAPFRRLVVADGSHEDTQASALFAEALQFLDIFVAQEVPSGACAGPYAGLDLTQAVARLRAEDPVRVLKSGQEPAPTCEDVDFEVRADTWPPPDSPWPTSVLDPTEWAAPPGQVRATSAYLVGDHSLSVLFPPATAGMDRTFEHVPARSPLGGALAPPRTIPSGQSLAWATPPVVDRPLFVGPASLDLTIKVEPGPGEPPVLDVELEAAIWEVDALDNRTLIQSGWVRASHRTPGPGATALDPDLTHSSLATVPANVPFDVRIPFPAFAHQLSLGSTLEVTLSAPGYVAPMWDLLSDPNGTVGTVTVVQGAEAASPKLVMPWVALREVPAAPTGVVVDETSPGTYEVTWDAVVDANGLPISYRVELLPGLGFVEVGAGVTTAILSGLPPGITAVRVRGRSGGLLGPPSAPEPLP